MQGLAQTFSRTRIPTHPKSSVGVRVWGGPFLTKSQFNKNRVWCSHPANWRPSRREMSFPILLHPPERDRENETARASMQMMNFTSNLIDWIVSLCVCLQCERKLSSPLVLWEGEQASEPDGECARHEQERLSDSGEHPRESKWVVDTTPHDWQQSIAAAVGSFHCGGSVVFVSFWNGIRWRRRVGAKKL